MMTQLLFLALFTLARATLVVAEAIVLDGREFLSTSVMVDGEEKTLVPGTRVTISFHDGHMSASAGCNTMHSEAYFVEEDDILKFDDGLSGTEIGCGEELYKQDQIIVDLLGSQPKVVLEENTLVLSADAVTIEFLDSKIADPDRPLVGTDWLENGFFDKVFASKSNVDKAGWVKFSDDEKVAFFDGCTEGELMYSTVSDDGLINFEVPEGRVTCDDSVPENIDAYAANFNKIFETGSVSYEIDGVHLKISNENGDGVSFMAGTIVDSSSESSAEALVDSSSDSPDGTLVGSNSDPSPGTIVDSSTDSLVLGGRKFWSTRVMVDGEEKTLVPGSRVAIRFYNDGRISASGGCNSIQSEEPYSVDEDDILTIGGGGGMTEMWCGEELNEQDQLVAKLLWSKPKVVLEENTLVLSTDAIIIEFLDRKIADPDRPLVGIDWLENGFFDKVFASKSNVDKAGWIKFSHDDKVAYFDGCAEGELMYTSDDKLINFEGAESRVTCADSVPDNVEAYAANFNKIFETGSVSYEIDGVHLKISNENGDGVSFMAGTIVDGSSESSAEALVDSSSDSLVVDGREFWSTSVMVDGEENTLVPGTRVTIRFHDDGRISASAGCNLMQSETYSVDEDDILTIDDDMAMTMLYCEQEGLHDQDQFVAEFLMSQPKVVLEENTLVLSTDTIAIVFLDSKIADPDRPLVGTDWLENGFFDKVTASKSNVDKAGWIKFSDDGKVAFFDGCVVGELMYSDASDDELINFEVAKSRITCAANVPDNVEAYSADFNKIFETGSVRYKIDGVHLKISNENGDGVSFRAGTIVDSSSKSLTEALVDSSSDSSAGARNQCLGRRAPFSVMMAALLFALAKY